MAHIDAEGWFPMLERTAPGRAGISLLEVLIALSIFLISLIGIGQLITISGQQTLEVSERGYASQLAHAKLAEVIAGALPLTSQMDTPFDEDPEWNWSLTAEQDSVAGLWNVEVRVSRERADATSYEAKLHQKVLDPSIRGSTLDAAAAAAASGSSTTSTTQSPATTGSTPTTGSATSQSGGSTPTGSTGASSPQSTAAPASTATKSAAPAAPASTATKSAAPAAGPATGSSKGGRS